MINLNISRQIMPKWQFPGSGQTTNPPRTKREPVSRTAESRWCCGSWSPLFGLRSSTTSWLGLLWLSSQGVHPLVEGSIFDTLYTEQKREPKMEASGHMKQLRSWIELWSNHTIRILRRQSNKMSITKPNKTPHCILNMFYLKKLPRCLSLWPGLLQVFTLNSATPGVFGPIKNSTSFSCM